MARTGRPVARRRSSGSELSGWALTGLFGIETEPETGGSGPVCVFVSVANEHRIGPGRLWVQLSRRLAAEGFRCVRFDVNGFGDSPARDGLAGSTCALVLAIDDVLDVARAVSPEDPGNVVLFGLCSSGYQVLEAALTLSPRGVCALNPSSCSGRPRWTRAQSMDARRRSACRRPLGGRRSATRRPVDWTALSGAHVETPRSHPDGEPAPVECRRVLPERARGAPRRSG